MRSCFLLVGCLILVACGRERPVRYAYASTCGYAPYPPCERPAPPAPPRAPAPPPPPAAPVPNVNPLAWIGAWTAQLPEAAGLPGMPTVPGLPQIPGLPTPGSTPGTAPSGDWPADWTAFEDAVLVETNQRRAQGAQCGERVMPPAPPLTLDLALRTAARRHSSDMAEHDFLSHIGSDGSRPEQRIRDAGYKTKKVIGENAAAGYPTPKIVVDEWMTSRGHCINIMHKGFVHLGVGFVYRGSSSHQEFWTQNFGGG